MPRITLQQLNSKEKIVLQVIGACKNSEINASNLVQFLQFFFDMNFDYISSSELPKILLALNELIPGRVVSVTDDIQLLLNGMSGNGLIEFYRHRQIELLLKYDKTLPEFMIKLSEGAKAYIVNLEKDRDPVIWDSNQQIFVACAFGRDDVNQLVNSEIKPLIERFGYQSVVMNERKAPYSIDDEIMQQIRQSYAFVADLTYARPSVYYEVGFAKALGMKTFLICRHDHENNAEDTERIHFDLRNHTLGYWQLVGDSFMWTGNSLENQFLSEFEASNKD